MLVCKYHSRVSAAFQSCFTCCSAYNNNNNRAITAAGVPVTKEPVGFARLDGKRPDGLTLIPWQGGKPLTWDVMVVSTLADSYLHSTSHSAGSTAETTSVRKETKYSSLPPDFIFQPVAIETLGPLNACALSEVGRRLTSLSEDSHETSFLFQCLSMLISTSTLLWLWTPSASLTKTWTSSHQWYLFLASSF